MGTRCGVIRSVMYVSRSLISGQIGLLEELRQQCVSHNSKLGVTGGLYYDNDTFCQILEGKQQTVLKLVNRISEDPRHQDLRVLLDIEVTRRLFEEWSMKFVSGISRPGMPEKFSYQLMLEGNPQAWSERAFQLRSA